MNRGLRALLFSVGFTFGLSASAAGLASQKAPVCNLPLECRPRCGATCKYRVAEPGTLSVPGPRLPANFSLPPDHCAEDNDVESKAPAIKSSTYTRVKYKKWVEQVRLGSSCNKNDRPTAAWESTEEDREKEATLANPTASFNTRNVKAADEPNRKGSSAYTEESSAEKPAPPNGLGQGGIVGNPNASLPQSSPDGPGENARAAATSPSTSTSSAPSAPFGSASSVESNNPLAGAGQGPSGTDKLEEVIVAKGEEKPEAAPFDISPNRAPARAPKLRCVPQTVNCSTFATGGSATGSSCPSNGWQRDCCENIRDTLSNWRVSGFILDSSGSAAKNDLSGFGCEASAPNTVSRVKTTNDLAWRFDKSFSTTEPCNSKRRLTMSLSVELICPAHN